MIYPPPLSTVLHDVRLYNSLKSNIENDTNMHQSVRVESVSPISTSQRIQVILFVPNSDTPLSENIIQRMFSKRNVRVEGSVDPQFLPVREAFQENFTSGEEVSAQVCVLHRGKVVVDLWGSVTDQSYTGDTVQQIWSSTKNLTALAVAMLVDR